MGWGGGARARESPLVFFFLREFFSRALLSERLEQANNWKTIHSGVGNEKRMRSELDCSQSPIFP